MSESSLIKIRHNENQEEGRGQASQNPTQSNLHLTWDSPCYSVPEGPCIIHAPEIEVEWSQACMATSPDWLAGARVVLWKEVVLQTVELGPE